MKLIKKHTVQCAMDTGHWTVQHVQYAHCTLDCTVCTLYTVLYNVQYMYSTGRVLYVQCTMYNGL